MLTAVTSRGWRTEHPSVPERHGATGWAVVQDRGAGVLAVEAVARGVPSPAGVVAVATVGSDGGEGHEQAMGALFAFGTVGQAVVRPEGAVRGGVRRRLALVPGGPVPDVRGRGAALADPDPGGVDAGTTPAVVAGVDDRRGGGGCGRRQERGRDGTAHGQDSEGQQRFLYRVNGTPQAGRMAHCVSPVPSSHQKDAGWGRRVGRPTGSVTLVRA